MDTWMNEWMNEWIDVWMDKLMNEWMNRWIMDNGWNNELILSLSQVSLSRVGSTSVLGLRKQNEDRLRVARIHDNLLYFAVFDGHGGPHAADYCYTFMEKFIRFKFIKIAFQMTYQLINVSNTILIQLLIIPEQRCFGGGWWSGESFEESLSGCWQSSIQTPQLLQQP